MMALDWTGHRIRCQRLQAGWQPLHVQRTFTLVSTGLRGLAVIVWPAWDLQCWCCNKHCPEALLVITVRPLRACDA